MKSIIRTIIYIILFFTVSSCAKEAPGVNFLSESKSDFKDDDEIHVSEFVDVNTENVLLQQILHGYQCEAVYEDSTKYTIGENELIALGDVLAEEMTQMGLELNPELFCEKVKQTHGIDASKMCYFSLTERRAQMYMIHELFAPEPKYDFKINLSDSRYHRVEEVVVDPRVGLMYPVLFLPEVIDYSEKYPEIKKAEKLAVMPKVHGERIKKWSQEKIGPEHKEALKMIYHINNYILYENRASLDWLVKNCMSVLQAMFVDFHMEHEPIIDSLVLVRTRSGAARLEALFAERNADGSVYIRKGLLDYISQNERLKAPRFQTTIRQYVAGCFGQDIYYDRMERFPKVLVDNFTLEERRMIVANIMNTVFSLYSGAESGKIMKVIIDNDPGFINNAVKKNYYGFENLRSGLSIYRMRFRAQKWKTITPPR